MQSKGCRGLLGISSFLILFSDAEAPPAELSAPSLAFDDALRLRERSVTTIGDDVFAFGSSLICVAGGGMS